MNDEKLAILGGRAVRTQPWPKWPTPHVDTEELLLDVLRSQRWAISGPYTGQTCYERRFAAAFAAYNGQRYCIPTANGTAALTVSLLALGVGPGDEVLVPGLAWVACASSVVSVGAVPILVDIERETLAMGLEQARAAITDHTAAILLVHPYCRFADVDGFSTLSRQHGIPIVEDCSHAHGACWRGRRAGSFGTIGCFSMQQTKVLTSGEGGAALTDDADLSDRMEQLRSDGRRFTANPTIGLLELEDVGGVLGQNHSLSDFQAAILLSRLNHLDNENACRGRFVDTLLQWLPAIDGVRCLPLQEEVTSYTYYRLVVELDSEQFSGNNIRTIAKALSAELGVHVSPIPAPLNNHCLYNPSTSPQIKQTPSALLDPRRFNLPVAESVCANHLTFPHPVLLSGEDGVRDIVSALAKIQRCARELVA